MGKREVDKEVTKCDNDTDRGSEQKVVCRDLQKDLAVLSDC